MGELPTQSHRISNSGISKQFETNFRSIICSSNLSEPNKNPELYTTPHQIRTAPLGSPFRNIAVLTPCFAFHFIAELCALVSVLNIKSFNAPQKMGGYKVTHFIFGGLLSVILMATSQKLSRKFPGSRTINLILFLLHFLYLLSGLLLVFGANLVSLMNIQVNNTDEDARNITKVLFPETESKDHDQVTALTIYRESWTRDNSSLSSSEWTSIVSLAGYTIMMSAPASGQYLLTIITISTSEVFDYGKVMSLSTKASALGGSALCVLGLLNFPVDEFKPSSTKERHLLKTFLLICAAIGLLVICTLCCITAWCYDVIATLFRAKQSETDNAENALPRDRKRTRTAQEIYDECAPLLGRLPHPNPCFQLDHESGDCETKELGHSETALDGSGESSKADTIPLYARAVPSAARLFRVQAVLGLAKRRKNLACALVLTFLLASSGLAFEFSASVLMSSAASGASDMVELDKACVGLLIMYLTFTALLCLYDKVTLYIDWKRLALGFSLLAALWTWPLAINHDETLFYVVACIQGLFKVTSAYLPLVLTSQSVRLPMESQKNPGHYILLDNAATALWCMPAVGLVVFALLTAPSFFNAEMLAVPMYYSTTTAFFSLIGLLFLL